MGKIMTKFVYIEGERAGSSYHQMWAAMGYRATTKLEQADVIQFTGGEDVSPELYGEAKHPLTGNNICRDDECGYIFEFAKEYNIPMAGICRGGQFLNVANGGKMFQHCDGHAIFGTHKATILETGLVVDVTSTHHQIMRPNRDTGIVIMESKKLGNFKEYMGRHDILNPAYTEWVIENDPDADDVEAVYYPDTNSLCFQPHCEYMEFDHPCSKTYRYFLRNYLGLDVPC